MLAAVVTGASRGLGRQTAIALGKTGYAVAVNYHQSKSDAEEVVLSMGSPSLLVRADVGNLCEVQEMAERIHREWGRIDLIINNAGIARDGLLVKYSEDDWDEVIRVNLKGCFNTVKTFVPLMLESGGGHIINISSRSGLRGKAGQAAYSASKASIIGLTYTLAKELAGYNIRVNSVLPGYMDTTMGVRAQKAMSQAKEESLIGSLSNVEGTASFIAYLASTENITGQIFSLDSRI